MLASSSLCGPAQSITPITCEACDGTALLRRRTIDAFRRDGSETWTFECVDCGYQMQQSRKVPDYSAG
jgi:Zn ribbon nucleic-acid-binding protein